jgi:hypothetical protein
MCLSKYVEDEMKNGNGMFMQVVREVGGIFESIWQSLKDSGPCCGIRFNKRVVERDPILCACYKMRM